MQEDLSYLSVTLGHTPASLHRELALKADTRGPDWRWALLQQQSYFVRTEEDVVGQGPTPADKKHQCEAEAPEAKRPRTGGDMASKVFEGGQSSTEEKPGEAVGARALEEPSSAAKTAPKLDSRRVGGHMGGGA